MSALSPGRYMIRQKVLKFFGAAFFITDDNGHEVGYCNQKAFKLREDIRLYTDRSQTEKLLSIRARSVIDFSATYDVFSSDGEQLGSARRRGLKSMLRDEWLIFDDHGREAARLTEDSGSMAVARRIIPAISLLVPQRFNLITDSGETAASYQTMRNLFVYKLEMTIGETDEIHPDLMLALGFLIAAIEGRQGSNSSGSGVFSGG